MKNLLLFFLFILFSKFCSSQEIKHHIDTIRYYKNRYYIDDKMYIFPRLKPFLVDYPSSRLELKKYKQNATLRTLFSLASITFGVIGFNKTVSSQLPFFNFYTITQFSTGFLGFVFYDKANKQFKKAVKSYNREKLND